MDTKGIELDENEIPLDDSFSEVIKEVSIDEEPREREQIYGKRKTFGLHSYKELPPYMRDNHYITDGYRVHFTTALCIKSLFRWHNETLSIWTHLLGFILFFVLMIVTLGVFIEEPTGIDIFIFMVFLIVAQLQMLFSTIFHMFGCCSPDVYTWLAKLDYSGITVMIVGSYFPPLFYGLQCAPVWRIVYLTLISFLGVIGLIVSSLKIFSTSRFRVVRAVFFIVFGCFAVFPMPHMVGLTGIDYMWPILWREFLMGASYIIGAVIYSTRVPERYYPGRFNTSWSSHPIWHIFVILGGLFQLWTCVFSFYQRRAHPCPSD